MPRVLLLLLACAIVFAAEPSPRCLKHCKGGVSQCVSYIYSTCKNQCQPDDVKQQQAQVQQQQAQSPSAPLPPISSLDLDPKCLEECKLSEGMASCTAFFDVCLHDCENFLTQLKPIDKQQLECEQDCVDELDSCVTKGNHPSPKLAQIQTAHENVTKTLMQDYAPQGKECVQSFLPCLNKCASTRTASLNQLFGEFDEDEDWEELGYHIPRAPRGGRKKKIPVEQFFDDEDLSDDSDDDDFLAPLIADVSWLTLDDSMLDKALLQGMVTEEFEQTNQAFPGGCSIGNSMKSTLVGGGNGMQFVQQSSSCHFSSSSCGKLCIEEYYTFLVLRWDNMMASAIFFGVLNISFWVIIALHWSFIANMATVMLLCYIGVNFVLPRFAVAENATNEGDFALAINTMQRIHGICRTVVCRVVEAKGDSPSRFHMIIIVSLVVLALFGQLFSHPPIIWTILNAILLAPAILGKNIHKTAWQQLRQCSKKGWNERVLPAVNKIRASMQPRSLPTATPPPSIGPSPPAPISETKGAEPHAPLSTLSSPPLDQIAPNLARFGEAIGHEKAL